MTLVQFLMQNAYFSHFVRNHWAIPENAILLRKNFNRINYKMLKKCPFGLNMNVIPLHETTIVYSFTTTACKACLPQCKCSGKSDVMLVIFCIRAFTETTSANHPTRWPQLRVESWSNESGQNWSCWCSHYPHDTRTYDGGGSTHFVNLLDQELGNWRVWCKYHISAVNNILRKLHFMLSLLLQRD